MKKSFKLFLAAAFLVTEFFVVALPLMITSAKADGHPIQAITLQPAPPTPITVILGFSCSLVGSIRFIVIIYSLIS